MPNVSRRGVYYNLEETPFVYTLPNGVSFRFSSRARLDMFIRKIDNEKERIARLVNRLHDPYYKKEKTMQKLYEWHISYTDLYNSVENYKGE